MTFERFIESLSDQSALPGITDHLKALWYDAKGDWNKAHHTIQDMEDKNASWIHAYLHRKEGDIANADYWYNHAGKKRPGISLKQEWESLVKELIIDN